jgi:hypothetical protein
MDRQGIRAHELLGYLPESLLDELSVDTGVNYQVKKLSGKLIFTLLLYAVLNTTRLSLNVLVNMLESSAFRALSNIEPELHTRRNSLADRLATIKVEYFERLFEATTALFRSHFASDSSLPYRINRFDSTIVSCSSKLLSLGMVNGIKPKDESTRRRQLKFTIGFDGLTVSDCKLYTEQSYLAEDKALGESIEKSSISDKEVVVFDRGLKKRKTFRFFSEQGRLFVTRINPTTMFEPTMLFSQSAPRRTSTVEVLSDQMVYLYGQGSLLRFPFRLIIARSLSSGEKLFFLTNIFSLKAAEVTDIYRKRWEIELFFRFLKQELNFSHLICRNQNGIMVMVYITLIAAMMVLVYRKLNGLTGFKIVKLRFVLELQTEIIKEIVYRCGGNPQLIKQFMPSG